MKGGHPTGTRRPTPTNLWQFGLHWLGDAINVMIPHSSFDDERMKQLLIGLRRVGEQPTNAAMAAYLALLWPGAPHTQRQVRDLWRVLLRNPNHQFRMKNGDRDAPLYVVDVLIERHGLRSLEDRLGVVLRDAARDFHAAAVGTDQGRYAATRKTLKIAIASVHSMRRLRVGKSVLEEPVYPLGDERAGLPRRPRDAD